jgi:formate-dependent nitrite reductase membrane component NrfD
LGTWTLTLFGLFSTSAFAWALVETGRLRWAPVVRAAAWAGARPRPLMLAWNVAGSCFGFGLAGYTGVLVSATTIPVWHNARLMGALFLVSAASTSYALLVLLLLRGGAGRAGPTVAKLARADRFSMVLELILIVLLLVILGRAARPLVSGGFGALFWIGVVGLGLLWPLVLHARAVRGWAEPRREMIAAVCGLVGGLLLRFVVVMAPQFPAVSLWAL